jgi:hypothetical protein
VDPTSKLGHARATAEIGSGVYADYGRMAKSFVDTRHFNLLTEPSFDQGQHMPCDDYHMTNLCLAHYHARNYLQMREKSLSNVTGLGYDPSSDEALDAVLRANPRCDGHHHVAHLRDMLRGVYVLPLQPSPAAATAAGVRRIDLSSLKSRLLGLSA